MNQEEGSVVLLNIVNKEEDSVVSRKIMNQEERSVALHVLNIVNKEEDSVVLLNIVNQEVQYQDFRDTKQITTQYDDLRFSISESIQESKGDHNLDCSSAELAMAVDIHWLAGLYKMDAYLRNPAKFKVYKKHLKQYLSKRVSKTLNSKCTEYVVRTDCRWALEESDIKDACAVIVDLLGLDDAKEMEISGELARRSLLIQLKPPQHNV